MNKTKPDKIGLILLFTLFFLLAIAGLVSYQSIDKDVLHKLESKTLILPTPIPATDSSQTK